MSPLEMLIVIPEKLKFYLFVSHWCDPSLALAPKQTEQYCNHGESLVICFNLTDLEIKFCFPPVAPEGRSFLPSGTRRSEQYFQQATFVPYSSSIITSLNIGERQIA